MTQTYASRDSGPAATSGATARAQLPSTWAHGRPGSFTILVESSRSTLANCAGTASTGGGMHPLSGCAHLEHFCSAPACYPPEIGFYLDSATRRRPVPFRPPELTVALDFSAGNRGSQRMTIVSDTAPRYLGAGHPLAPSFGQQFAGATSESGSLTVWVRLRGPTAGWGSPTPTRSGASWCPVPDHPATCIPGSRRGGTA